MDPVTWLRNVATTIGPLFIPAASVVLIIMALGLAAAFNNPSAKAAIKGHLVDLALAGFLALAGAGALVWFFGRTGLPTG